LLAVLLAASLVITGLAYSVPPAAAANGTGPADLINDLQLQKASSPLSTTVPLYTATPAQQASLEDLEQQAVQNTITDHGLVSSDAAAAQTWGRDASESELWALLVQAINTPAAQQTTDQACPTGQLAGRTGRAENETRPAPTQAGRAGQQL
jgi:hypothetical protein